MLFEYFRRYIIRTHTYSFTNLFTNPLTYTHTLREQSLYPDIFCQICIFWSNAINQIEGIVGIIEWINRFENGKLFFSLMRKRSVGNKAWMKTAKNKIWNKKPYVISPYPTVVIVTTAHQKPSGMDLKWECGDPASAK